MPRADEEHYLCTGREGDFVGLFSINKYVSRENLFNRIMTCHAKKWSPLQQLFRGAAVA